MVLFVSCDQVTKIVAQSRLKSEPSLSCLGGMVRLTYAENPGGFLSLGASLPSEVRSWLFVPLTAMLLVGLGVVLVRDGTLSTTKVVGLSLMAAGAAGNLIDRVAFGTVRDFLNVGIGPLRTGVFNVADFAVTTGVVLLLALSVFSRDRA
jgi:signal peptidase II